MRSRKRTLFVVCEMMIFTALGLKNAWGGESAPKVEYSQDERIDEEHGSAFIPVSEPLGEYIRIGGWIVFVEGPTLGPDFRVFFKRGTVQLYETMGGGKIVIPDIIVSPSGEPISSGVGTAPISFVAENGFRVTVNSYAFASDGLRLGGSIFFPKALGENVEAKYAPGEIFLDPNGSVTTREKTDPIKYHAMGWDIQASGYRFDSSGLYIASNSITITCFDAVRTIVIPDMAYYSDGEIRKNGPSYEEFFIPYPGYAKSGISVQRADLSAEGLFVSAYVDMPPSFNAASMYFGKCLFSPDGDFRAEPTIRDYECDLFFGSSKTKGPMNIVLKNISFGTNSYYGGFGVFTVYKATLVLPESLGSIELKMTNAVFKLDGSIDLLGFECDPFKLWDMEFKISNIELKDNTLNLGGSFYLPENAPGRLAGEEFLIKNLKVDLLTNDIDFSSRTVNYPYEVPLMQSSGSFPWGLTIENFAITAVGEDIVFKVDEGSISFFPPDGVKNFRFMADAKIRGFSYCPSTNEFVLEKAVLDPMIIVKNGKIFNLVNIAFSKSGTSIPSSKWVLPVNVPQPFRGYILTGVEMH